MATLANENLKGEYQEMENEKYYIIRCDRAGVFFAHVEDRRGDEADLTECRRLWYWDGAASLSQLAMEGVSKPRRCQFSVTVPSMTVLGVIEIIPCTEKAVESIKAVAEWRA